MTALPLDAADAEFDRARQFTIPFSLAGLPAISVPCGLDRNGLPIGLQVVGERLCEPLVLRIAAAYETAAATLRRPGERRPKPARRNGDDLQPLGL
jgi:aspartyl-tRNA(Asn)/glutamyl-tRNA(Gln) amidotransferase subunit A